jgi:ribosomal protein L7/L12
MKEPEKEFIELFSFLAATDEDRELLNALASYVCHIETEDHEHRVVLHTPECWYLLHAYPPRESDLKPSMPEEYLNVMRHHSDLMLSLCFMASDVATTLEEQDAVDIGVSFWFPDWCDPFDWLTTMAENYDVAGDEEIDAVDFVLACVFGCYFLTSSHRQERRMVFVDRDDPLPGLNDLFDKPRDNEQEGEPSEYSHLAHLKTGSLYLKLAHRYIVESIKTYKVKLVSGGHRKMDTIKGLSTMMGLSLTEARDLVERSPVILEKGIETYDAANELVKKLKELGAEVVMSDE